MEFSEITKSILLLIITGLASLLSTYGAKLLKGFVVYFKSKTDYTTYNSALELAKGIYLYLEDKYDISGMGEIKKKEMEAMLLEKYPTLTQADLDSINKIVCNSFKSEFKRLN